jgi:hypothetical protein
MQHYIQDIEGFATGGSTSFSDFIVAIGGSEIRKFFLGLNEAEKILCKEIDENKINAFNEYLNNVENSMQEVTKARGIFKSIRKNFASLETFRENSRNVIFHLCYLYMFYNVKIPSLRAKFKELFGVGNFALADILEMAVTQTKEKTEYYRKKGWSDNELSLLYFNTYLSLAGEYESREVQNTAEINKELLEYFKFYSSETIPKEKVTVLFDEGTFEDAKYYLGACERYDGDKYVIHTSEQGGEETLIHELGHIVHDEAKKINTYNLIIKQYSDYGKKSFDDISEFFVECFMCYVCRKDFDSNLTKRLKTKRLLMDRTETDSFFDFMLGYEVSRVDSKLIQDSIIYVNKLQKLI